jgi:hypothetical protein
MGAGNVRRGSDRNQRDGSKLSEVISAYYYRQMNQYKD